MPKVHRRSKYRSHATRGFPAPLCTITGRQAMVGDLTTADCHETLQNQGWAAPNRPTLNYCCRAANYALLSLCTSIYHKTLTQIPKYNTHLPPTEFEALSWFCNALLGSAHAAQAEPPDAPELYEGSRAARMAEFLARQRRAQFGRMTDRQNAVADIGAGEVLVKLFVHDVAPEDVAL